jgi:MFS family permease
LSARTKRGRFFTGWWSVLFIGIISGIGHGFNTYGISVIFKPIAAELGLDRAATSWAPGIGRLEGGVTSPLVGWLSDKFGPRGIVIIGICIAGIGLVLMYFITEVWHYYVAWGALIGLGLNIGLTVAVDKNINDWFIRYRGLAQGIKFGLISVFGIIVVQAITPMMELQGWRFICLIWGIIMFASIPFAYVLVKPQRPEYYGMLPDGATTQASAQETERSMIERGVGYASSFEETEYTFKQAAKTGTYWLLIIGFSVHNIIGGGFNIHVFPFLTDIGIDEVAAGGMMGLMIFFSAPTRFFGGIVVDRIRKNRLHLLLVGAFMLQVIGLGSYLWYQSLPAVYVLLACHGLSTGAVTPIVVLILGRFFGRKAFGAILGTAVALLAPMGLLAPVFYGWVYDTYGSYNTAFIVALVLAVMAVVFMFFIRAPKLPSNGNFERKYS